MHIGRILRDYSRRPGAMRPGLPHPGFAKRIQNGRLRIISKILHSLRQFQTAVNLERRRHFDIMKCGRGMAGAAPSYYLPVPGTELQIQIQFQNHNHRMSGRQRARTHGYGGTYAEYYIRCN